MDVLERVCREIETIANALNLRSEGFRCEIEESIADIKESHFVLSWQPGVIEPRNTADSLAPYANLFNEEDAAFLMAIPIRLIFKSKGTGEVWRRDMVHYTTEFNMLFWLPQNVDSLGPAQHFFFELSRDSGSDIKQKVVEDEMNEGFVLEQHWTGYIIMQTKRNNNMEA